MGPYGTLWLEFWIISLASYLAYCTLGCYTRLEARRPDAAEGLLRLLGVVFFILGVAVKALTR